MLLFFFSSIFSVFFLPFKKYATTHHTAQITQRAHLLYLVVCSFIFIFRSLSLSLCCLCARFALKIFFVCSSLSSHLFIFSFLFFSHTHLLSHRLCLVLVVLVVVARPAISSVQPSACLPSFLSAPLTDLSCFFCRLTNTNTHTQINLPINQNDFLIFVFILSFLFLLPLIIITIIIVVIILYLSHSPFLKHTYITHMHS